MANDYVRIRADVPSITLTYGETQPYVWRVYLDGVPEYRYITKDEAIDRISRMADDFQPQWKEES